MFFTEPHRLSTMIKPSPIPLFPGEDAGSGRQEVPEWVGKVLQLPVDSINQVRVDQFSSGNNAGQYCPPKTNKLYESLLAYFAYFAVDPDEPIMPVDPEAVEDPKSNARRVKGSLSSLFYLNHKDPCQDEEAPKRGYFYYDSDAEEEAERWGRAVLHFGYGTARVQVQGKDVCILHRVKGQPVCDTSMRREFVLSGLCELHLFAADPTTVQELLDSVIEWDLWRKAEATPWGKFNLHTLTVRHEDARWHNEGLKASRSLKSIVLPDGMLGRIVADYNEFAAEDTEEWYLTHGLPHRRSYLFYGPPGSGKTSVIRALAGEFKLPAYFLSLGDVNIGNTQLLDALRFMPKKAMLVIEDIDALFNKERQSKSSEKKQLTFSGLLNALDGLVSSEGAVTVMTTNHIEKLDPALVRAGRVDRKFEFKPPTYEQVAALFQSFYPDAGSGLAAEFADKVFKCTEGDVTSMATLQEHFNFTRRKTARESVDCLDDFFSEFYAQSIVRQGAVVDPIRLISNPAKRTVAKFSCWKLPSCRRSNRSTSSSCSSRL